MELYIQLKNNQPFDHPILGDNFREAFPDIDTNNLPDWVARFNRVEPPKPGIYQEYAGVSYQLVDGVFTDVHSLRDMTTEEKTAKQNAVKELWASEVKFESWIFNEDTCAFDPPIPRPVDGFIYRWDEANQQWVNVDGEEIGVTLV